MKPSLMLSLGATLCTASASYAGGVCDVKSGRATAALVELYTSEGCSSCPPADRQLSNLRRQLDADAIVVPLALHVSYWDRIGWKDVFAQRIFDARQRALLEKRHNKVAYTPQFFVNGTELRDWSTALPAEIRRTNAIPAPLTISLKSTAVNPAPTTAAGATLLLESDVAAADPRTAGALYLALSESGLVSHVLRGENGGATLRHDDTVRLWLGPFPLAQGKTHVRQEIRLPAAWRSERVQAVAFVQSADDARILQALSTAQCQAATSARSL
ncbi:MAG: DUF1223 domain-containing protein [Massilia sp.]|nr:DUF1223 domain-containing protein [Massilia sp.]